MAEEKMGRIEVPKPQSFLRRYKVLFVAITGVFALHLGWWQLVESYVPVEERPKRFEVLGKLDRLIHKNASEKN